MLKVATPFSEPSKMSITSAGISSLLISYYWRNFLLCWEYSPFSIRMFASVIFGFEAFSYLCSVFRISHLIRMPLTKIISKFWRIYLPTNFPLLHLNLNVSDSIVVTILLFSNSWSSRTARWTQCSPQRICFEKTEWDCWRVLARNIWLGWEDVRRTAATLSLTCANIPFLLIAKFFMRIKHSLRGSWLLLLSVRCIITLDRLKIP